MVLTHKTHELFTESDFVADKGNPSKLEKMVVKGKLKVCKNCELYGFELTEICESSEFHSILKENPSREDLAGIIIDLQKNVVNLTDIIVNVTHHEGALAEYKKQWMPIVQVELKSRAR